MHKSPVSGGDSTTPVHRSGSPLHWRREEESAGMRLRLRRKQTCSEEISWKCVREQPGTDSTRELKRGVSFSRRQTGRRRSPQGLSMIAFHLPPSKLAKCEKMAKVAMSFALPSYRLNSTMSIRPKKTGDQLPADLRPSIYPYRGCTISSDIALSTAFFFGAPLYPHPLPLMPVPRHTIFCPRIGTWRH